VKERGREFRPSERPKKVYWHLATIVTKNWTPPEENCKINPKIQKLSLRLVI
jgi:hypothetical protein